MLCRLGQLMYDTLLLASNMINPKNVTHIYVAFESFVLYAGGGYALYPNIMLLVQVMAYVMSGTFVLDMVRRLT